MIRSFAEAAGFRDMVMTSPESPFSSLPSSSASSSHRSAGLSVRTAGLVLGLPKRALFSMKRRQGLFSLSHPSSIYLADSVPPPSFSLLCVSTAPGRIFP